MILTVVPVISAGPCVRLVARSDGGRYSRPTPISTTYSNRPRSSNRNQPPESGLMELRAPPEHHHPQRKAHACREARRTPLFDNGRPLPRSGTSTGANKPFR